MNLRVLLPRLLELNARVDQCLEFGSGGVMRQSRRLAAVAQINSTAHMAAADLANDRMVYKLRTGLQRASRDASGEKRDLWQANLKRLAKYQSRLGL